MANDREQIESDATVAATDGAVADTDDTQLPDDVVGCGATIASDEDLAHGGTQAATGEFADAEVELPVREPARYRRAQEIARGGMGRVIAARDRELGRAVAIKELLPGGSTHRRRFEREIRITARLQHPAIINVFEAGRWPSGEPFYAMKRVDGTALDEAIARRDSLRERLGLLSHMLAVADALAYAHGEGVIHRDLKPGNVLVGEYGETVVIDWGLAKDLTATEHHDDLPNEDDTAGDTDDKLTVAGQAMGTPAYMPPEQALGETVDERADVYALGAMLYHLLAGKMPFSGSRSAHEILEKLLVGPPRPIAELVPDAPRDLLAIVDKAMSRSPSDRYPSAAELAAELRRFETGQLVGAHDYSLWQLVRRWVARHRAPVAVAAVAAVVVAGLSVVGIQRIRRERSEAEAQRRIAEDKRADVEELLDFMVKDLHAKLEPRGQLEILGLVATKAADYYAQPASDRESEADARRRAAALTNVGDVLLAQGNTTAALQQFRAALAIHEEVAATNPSHRDALASSHDKIGDVLAARGDVGGAIEQYRISLSISDERIALHPDDDQPKRDASVAHERIGDVLLSEGKVADALEEYRASLDIARELAAKDPTDGDRQRALATSYDRIGDVMLDEGDADAALDQYRASLAIRQQLAGRDRSNATWQRGLAVAHDNIGNAMMATGDAADALERYRAERAVLETLAAQDPSNADWQRDLSLAHNKVGDALVRLGDTAGALEPYRAALEIREHLALRDPANGGWQLDLAASHANIGDALVELGKPNDALAHYRPAMDIAERLVARNPDNARWQRNLAVCHYNLAYALEPAGDHDGALAQYRAALAIFEELAANNPDNPRRQSDVAEVRNIVQTCCVDARRK